MLLSGEENLRACTQTGTDETSHLFLTKTHTTEDCRVESQARFSPDQNDREKRISADHDPFSADHMIGDRPL